jgi:hypothetical protein
MEKIIWPHRVRNEKVFLRVMEKMNIIQTVKRRKANWIGHILRSNCLLKRFIEGKTKGGLEVNGRRGRKRKKLLENFKETRKYCELKEPALDGAVWRTLFVSGRGSVVRQDYEMNELSKDNAVMWLE